MNSAYEVEVKLPSKGLPYADSLESVTIRPMTTKEEKYIYGSNQNRPEKLVKLLNTCVVPDSEGKKVDCSQLLAGDFDAVLIQLRIATYGDQYHLIGRCTSCGNEHEYKVSLNDLTIKDIDESNDFSDYSKVTLSNGDELELRLLNQKEILALDAEVDKRVKKAVGNDVNYDFLFMQELRGKEIVSINGKAPETSSIATAYVQELRAGDGAKIDFYANKLAGSFGLEYGIEVNCSRCGEAFELGYANTYEFFHPRFD